MSLDKFFKEIANLFPTKDIPKLANFFIAPFDRYGEVIKDYIQLGHKFSSEELFVSAVYFHNDFKKSLNFFNPVFSSINDFQLKKQKYSSLLEKAGSYVLRANSDFSYENYFLKMLGRDISSMDPNGNSQLKEVKRKLFFATEFPFHSSEIMFYHETINSLVKKENYELAQKEKEKLDKLILEYYSV